jgi:hypothetical protein
MTGVLKRGDSQPAGQALPEVEFALVLSRTINALNEDPSLLRSTVYELARITLRKDLQDNDPESAQRLAQALETAIRGVEDFEVRQNRGLGQGESSIGPTNKRSETAQLAAPKLPSVEVYPSSQHRNAALPVVQIDHPAFEASGSRSAFSQDKSAPRKGLVGRTTLIALGTALATLLVGVVIADRTGMRPSSANRTTSPQTSVVTAVESSVGADQASPSPASAPPSSNVPAIPPIPGLALPTTYGNYALNNGQLAELELLDGQVPDKRVAVSSPIHSASHTILPDGSPTFVIFRRDLAAIPTDMIEARVVARIRHTMKVDNQTLQATYAPEELWSIRPFSYRFRSAPVPGNPEMMLIKPDGVALPPGRYVLVLKRQGYDFTVAGKITDPNQCLERTEATNGTFYSPCSKIP